MMKILPPNSKYGLRLTPLVNGSYVSIDWWIYERYLNGGV